MEIQHLQEAESLSYYLLLQKAHMHPKGRRSDPEKARLVPWEMDYQANTHYLSNS